MDKKNSFESEGFSDCEENEIETKSIEKKDTINSNSTEIENNKLIESISQTLCTILENNKKMADYKEIVKKQSKVAFSANLIPKISIKDYLIRIQTYSNIEKSTLIFSLIYIDRLCHNSDVKLTYYNIHRILFSSILISIKYNEDSYYDNKFYSEIAGVKLKELKVIEYTFLELNDFNVYVNKAEFERYKQKLESFNKSPEDEKI